MNVFEMEKEFNDLIKHGQELIEKLKQAKGHVADADKNDIGMLCKFWNDNIEDYVVGTICEIEKRVDYPYCIGCCDCWYKHCCRLTPSEVAEITGYKVEK